MMTLPRIQFLNNYLSGNKGISFILINHEYLPQNHLCRFFFKESSSLLISSFPLFKFTMSQLDISIKKVTIYKDKIIMIFFSKTSEQFMVTLSNKIGL
jgi:hypothetical protein